jgi:hypothetical protein
MAKLVVVSAALVLLSVIALPGSADAGGRAEGLKNPGGYEVSAQRRRYAPYWYTQPFYGRPVAYPYTFPYFPPAPYVPLAPVYRLGPIVPIWW